MKTQQDVINEVQERHAGPPYMSDELIIECMNIWCEILLNTHLENLIARFLNNLKDWQTAFNGKISMKAETEENKQWFLKAIKETCEILKEHEN